VPLTAFADESFQEDPVHGFYVLAAAVFPPPIHDEVRERPDWLSSCMAWT
jgi:hypothetical protein